MTDKKQIDWERVEADYRAGVLSVREIAASQGITHGAINKRAKRDGWTRDLSAKIQAKAETLVSKREVSTPVSTDTASDRSSERLIVEANAEVIANVRLAHRADIVRGRALCMALLSELEGQTADVPALITLGEMLRKEDERGIDKLNDIYRTVISLPERTKTMKALADSLKVLISLEREAYGLQSAAAPPAQSTADLLRGIVEHLPN